QLVQRLRDQDPAVTPALPWLDKHLAAQGTTADELVREEHQRQAAMSVTVRNAITSMRLVSAVDWTEFFESVSLVDARLRMNGIFAEMDFPTRDRYRHAIEDLARGSKRPELEVTAMVIEMTTHASETSAEDPTMRRKQEPGYYLISKGRPALERKLGYRFPLRGWIERAAAGAGMQGYIATIAFLVAFFLTFPLLGLAQSGVTWYAVVILALLAVIPLSDVVVALVNRWVTLRFSPKSLPGLELRDGVPAELRTMVVIPTLLTTAEEIEEQIERLEVHYLSSQDGDIRFALLSDWKDAATETLPEDRKLLLTALDGIDRLNRTYGPAIDGPRFFLLHRRRLWNTSEEKWIGWERKRGKLEELNRLLRGATDTSFVNPGAVPLNVRYVITLDADTRLPRGAARRLVGKMEHPLNRPTLDPKTNRVIEGYAILQPRVTPSLPGERTGSFFQRLFSGPSGLDPYAFAISDVYQDLFGEGSYTGKGIYDVDVFSSALEGRIPENAILSHDLLEGIFAGAGLASDVEVIEEFPPRYDVAAARQHRWARGDWQLLPWILGRHSAVPLIGRWKMLDNLRRSLSAPAAFLALLAGWVLPFASAVAWSGFIFATILMPALLPVFDGLLPRRLRISKRSHFRGIIKDFSLAFSQVGFLVTMLAHQAWLMGDAIIRTLFRLLVSRKKLLEWVTAAQTQTGNSLDLKTFYRRLSGGAILAILAAILLVSTTSGYRLIALPFILLWILSPVVSWWASLPPLLATPKTLSTDDAQALRLVGRRTWRFFETFVGMTNHMLPPDNFQETPNPVVATRTSPTNIGLYLLSIISARDFGWIGTIDTIERLEATLATLSKLELFRGHLYNWYDTHDLRPLEPKYVSSVDSGNLAGHLLALGNACREILDRPLLLNQWHSGVTDALHITRESFLSMKDDRRTQTVTHAQLQHAIDSIATNLEHVSETPQGIAQQLSALEMQADTLTDICGTLVEERGDGTTAPANPELLMWSSAVRSTIKGHQRDYELLLPWARILSEKKEENNPGDLLDVLRAVPSLGELSDRCEALIVKLKAHESPPDLIDALHRSATTARLLEQRLLAIADRTKKMFNAMDFSFLFDKGRQLLSIGYRPSDGTLDPNCYDLLASEARLASFIAIAKGDIPVRHWFRLGRALTPVDRGSALISWSGSMFEYLMPTLVMRSPANSLLEQTCRLIVRRQISYGEELKIPWGISESAYNVRDIEFTYQYSNFGVPGLGLKRGLSEDAVVAPYATGLASMIGPEESVRNFARLAAAGAQGRYGFYEALDYTPSRLPEGESVAIVRAYMAHHEGMTLVAIANTLNDGIMQNRFHVEPIIQATDLLLQERTPRDVAVARPRAEEVKNAGNVRELVPPILRRFRSPHQAVPRTHLLSNGKYAVMITTAGSGYSRWHDLAITRWREDVTCDSWGTYIFLRDIRTGDVWSAAYQPSGVEPDSYEVMFSEDRAEFIRHDNSIITMMEVAVSPEDDGEVRRVSITNRGRRTREIELTSYAELVLAPPAADAAHPAFSKLFVQTEFVADVNALLATRRRRSPSESEIWAAHLAVVEGETIGEVEFETDRARFLGRGREVRTPVSVIDGRPLSNTVGAVLDPVFSLRKRLRIPAGATAHVAFWTLVGGSRSDILDQVDKHHETTAFDRALTLAWTQAQVQLHHLGVGPDEAHLFQRLANHVLYSDPSLRPSSEVLKQSELGPSTLWAHGISGDLPIILVRIDEAEDMEIVRQLLRAHEYWRMKRLAVDLVILNERAPSYSLDLQTALQTVLRKNESQLRSQADGEAPRGNVFVLRTDLVSMEVRTLLRSVARAVLLSRRGSLIEQVQRLEESETSLVARRTPFPFLSREEPKRPAEPEREESGDNALPGLEFFNGLGGFAAGGREYVVRLGEGQWTPAPWINVIANPSFGFHVSVEGSGYTWSMNSNQNQITPWSNDPVTDRPGEALYIRDEDSGRVWTPTVLPIREPGGQYIARHGQGYSRFEHTAHGIALDLLQYVPTNDPIKISRLKIHNISSHVRRLSVTAYVEWVLGPSRAASAPFIVTEIDPETGAMFARNSWRAESGQRIAFADFSDKQTAWTGDRTEFIGRNRTLDRPAALAADIELSNKVGAGMDPCGVLQTPVELRANE
ncbi:MAG: glucoamylase family protein, partial [bacterium]